MYSEVPEICSPTSADNAKIQKAKQTTIEDTKASQVSEILKALSDPTRIKIITAISEEELCVCEIALALNISQSLVSHQLQALRLLNLVKLRKNGRNMHYSLNNHVTLSIIKDCEKMLRRAYEPKTEKS